ncbi:iron-siderophore ABC transporter substrate-binding protein [soil metagenome]
MRMQARTSSRKHRAGGITIALVVALTVLGACGSDDTSEPSATPSPGQGPSDPDPADGSRPKTVRHAEVVAPEPSAATDPFPVTIEHAFGPTLIAEEPKRVVALETFDLETTFALGVTPLTIHAEDDTTREPVWAWADFSTKAAVSEFHLPDGRPDYEAISATSPDLIINVSTITSREEYDQLSTIAPTLTRQDESGRTGDTWQERTRILGKALGRTVRADALVSSLETTIASARSENPSFADKTVVLAQYGGPDEPIITASASSGLGALLGALGFVVADLPNQIDPAVLDVDELDVLVWQLSSGGTTVADIKADPRLESLPVMAEERVVYLEGEVPSAILFESVVSLRFGLDQLLPLLRAAAR